MDAVQARKLALLRRLAEMQATAAEADAQLSSTRREVKELQRDTRKAHDDGKSQVLHTSGLLRTFLRTAFDRCVSRESGPA